MITGCKKGRKGRVLILTNYGRPKHSGPAESVYTSPSERIYKVRLLITQKLDVALVQSLHPVISIPATALRILPSQEDIL